MLDLGAVIKNSRESRGRGPSSQSDKDPAQTIQFKAKVSVCCMVRSHIECSSVLHGHKSLLVTVETKLGEPSLQTLKASYPAVLRGILRKSNSWLIMTSGNLPRIVLV